MNSSDSLLLVHNLTVHLKIAGIAYPVVQELSFELKKGKTLAIVGESGCGKSMTALAILGLLPRPPALKPQGKIIYQEQNLLTLKEKELRKIRGKKISMIFQDPMNALNPVYSIGEQLMEVATTHLFMTREKAFSLALRALEDVHMPNPAEIMRLYPHQLSGGMLQRAMIAMALICEPDILIADEPTTALDVTIQAQILKLLKELQHKKGMTILLITHDMGVVAQNADEVIVMYAGSHVEKGSVHTLFEHPAHPYTQALFALRLKPQSAGKKLPAIPGSVPPIFKLPRGCPFEPRCKSAMETCKLARPQFYDTKEKDHSTRCLLYKEVQ